MKNFFKLLRLVAVKSDWVLFVLVVLATTAITLSQGASRLILLEALNHLDVIQVAAGFIILQLVVDLIATGLQSFRTVKLAKFRAILTNRTREILFDKVLKLDTQNFYAYSTGYIQDCVLNTKAISTVLNIMMNLFDAVLALGSTLVFVYLIDPTVSVIYMITIPIVFLVFKHFWEAGLEAQDSMNVYRKETTGIVSNAIKGFKTVKGFSRESSELEKISTIGVDWTAALMKSKRINAASAASDNIIFIAVNLAIIVYSVMARNTAQEILVLTGYTNSVLGTISWAIGGIEEIQEAIVTSNKVFDLIEVEDKIEDGKCELTSFSNDISFNSVGFGYCDNTGVLNDVSFTIKKGQRIGICGPSGGGKSTILSLLMRFYDTTSGTISIDGISIKDLTTKSLRNRIGMVQQDSYLFEGTIMENILYGKPDATEYEVVEAAKKANIHDFIASLEKGYRSQVGDNGIKLSGGQKQRIAIARVFLQNPDIILFDEATAALDNGSERIVQESIERLSDDKTIITVAHRLSTIKDCDTILVVDNHKIVEAGDYDSLVASGGLFAELAGKQTA